MESAEIARDALGGSSKVLQSAFLSLSIDDMVNISNGKCPIRSLPLEVIHYICSFLPRPADVINLSNACRLLFNALGPGSMSNRSWYRFFDHNEELKALIEKYKSYTQQELEIMDYLHRCHDPSSGLQFRNENNGYMLDRSKIFQIRYTEYNPNVDYRSKAINALHGHCELERLCAGCMAPSNLFFPETWCLLLGGPEMEQISFCKGCIRETGVLEVIPSKLLINLDAKRVHSAMGPSTNGMDLANFKALAASYHNPSASANVQNAVNASFNFYGCLPVPNDASALICYRADVETMMRKQSCATLTEYTEMIEGQITYHQTIGTLLKRTIIKNIRQNDSFLRPSTSGPSLLDEESLGSYLDTKWKIFCYSLRIPIAENSTLAQTDYDRILPIYQRNDNVIGKGPKSIQSAQKDYDTFKLNWMYCYYELWNLITPWAAAGAYNLDNSRRMKNIFSCFEESPTDGGLAEDFNGWLERAAEMVIKDWLSGPDAESEYPSRDKRLRMSEHYTVVYPRRLQHANAPQQPIEEQIELTFVERSIWEYASPKFSIRRHNKKAGLCRICNDDMYYTAFEYAFHLYIQHPDYFQEPGKWDFRTRRAPGGKVGKEITKQVITLFDLERQSHLSKAEKEQVLATKRYGPLYTFSYPYTPGKPRKLVHAIQYWGYYYLQ